MKKIIQISLIVLSVTSIGYNVYQYQESKSLIAYYSSSNYEMAMNFEAQMSILLEQSNDYRIRAEEAEFDLRALRNDARSKKISSNQLVYKVLKSVDLKEFQTDGSAVISTLKKGDSFTVLNSFFSEHWQVSFNGKKGWIKTKEDIVNEYGMRTGQVSIVEKLN